jgi:hypothetical protein
VVLVVSAKWTGSKKCIKPLENVRMARNIKVSHFTDVRTNIDFELV